MVNSIIKYSLFLMPPLSFLPSSDSKPESLEAHKIKTAFFTHPTLTEIGRRLVSHYFLLTEEELAMWEEDPESFGKSTSPKTQAESKCPLIWSWRLAQLTGTFFGSPNLWGGASLAVHGVSNMAVGADLDRLFYLLHRLIWHWCGFYYNFFDILTLTVMGRY